MCYNVLCDKYCTRQMYGYCPTWALNWEYRKKGIIEEIRHGAADIISLQVRESVPVSQDIVIRTFISNLSSVYRWEISTYISEYVLTRPVRISFPVSQILSLARLLNLWSEKAYGIKKSHVLKKISIRSLKWVYDITETVLCTMHGVGEKPWRSFTSVKQDWHQLKVNQNLQESKRNCFYFDKLQTSTCSCTIFVIVSSVGCGLCNSTLRQGF